MICDKKAFELRWLERFRVAAGLEFEIDDARQVREAPDILIRHRGRTVGVEVTSLQLDQHRASKKGSALQEGLAIRQRIIEDAQKRYFDERNPPINVTACFEGKPWRGGVRIDCNEVARSLVDDLHQLRLEDSEQRRLDQYSAPPVHPPISFLYARGLPAGIRPRWQVADPGWAGEFRPAAVERLLKEKNARIESYQQTVAENWLLIVADRLHSPGRFRPPEQNPLELPASAFDRTFLLCAPGPYSFLVDWNGGKHIRLPDSRADITRSNEVAGRRDVVRLPAIGTMTIL